MRTFKHERLEAWTRQMFEACGVPPDHAALTAAALADASLRGIDTHGVSRVPSYVGLIEAGGTRPRPEIKIEELSGFIRVDADRGLGQAAGVVATDALVARARESGTAIGIIREIGHLGALGYFTSRAADAGMIAVLMQNAPPMMGLPGSTTRGIGNNPMAFSAPAPGRPNVVFDMATSEAAFGKIIEASRSGAEIPSTWALGSDGRPTCDSREALRGVLLPAGGPKGIGLAMMIEALAGSLTGTDPTKTKTGDALPAAFGAFMMVVDPDRVIGRDAFEAHMTSWLEAWRRSSPEARYPGERPAETAERRRQEGIPLTDEVVAALAKTGDRKGVPFSS